MIPNKIYWFLGYNNLAFILEQERKHWLMKTDKKIHVQDNYTGSIYQGLVDNIGSDIVLESEKLPIDNSIIQSLKYRDPNVDDILTAYNSAFTYSGMVNGFMFARIKSITYPYPTGNTVEHKNYKIKFENCETCFIPFGGSLNSPDVFAGKWLRTKTAPKLLMVGEDDRFSISKSIQFKDNITNVVYYYPLTETLQPLDLTQEKSGSYISEAVCHDEMIGYPLYWFTCDQTDIGPTVIIDHNINTRGEQLMLIGNEGNGSKHKQKLYAGVGGNTNATPNGSPTSNYKIKCKSVNPKKFTNSINDFNVEIDPASIAMVDSMNNEYNLGIRFKYLNGNTITMSNNGLPWEYVDEKTYMIELSAFDNNCFELSQSALVSVFDVSLDESVPFYAKINDVAISGIRMGSGNPSSDVYESYPHDLNKWDGLPERMQNMSLNEISQHMAIYALHDTPTSLNGDPTNRQTAAILLDPGQKKITEDEGFANDERGRAYLLSNDDTIYENNVTTDNPKPDRTIARICDIPTSVMQLSDITGIAPSSIVDKKYVRTEASFTVEDKDRLYNTLADRWVRPSALDNEGIPVYKHKGEDNQYVFNNVESLKSVDLINQNQYRKYDNLNPLINSLNVTLDSIITPGTGYKVNDVGSIVVGGFTFNYIVKRVSETGSVVEAVVAPANNEIREINLSNFDLPKETAGETETYGTSPITGTGTGLSLRFYIKNYESILMKQSEILDGLFALVKEVDGLWLYQYKIDPNSTNRPKIGSWVKSVRISEYEQSLPNSLVHGISSSEAFMNSIIPSLREVPICTRSDNGEVVSLKTISTPSFINIVDDTKTPFELLLDSNDVDDRVEVDMNKFYCEGLSIAKADERSDDSIIPTLRKLNKLSYDSYLIWKWESETDTSNTNFLYGIIRNGFSNLLTTDATTMLPSNELKDKLYVNSNPSTTVVWNVDKFGVMLWVYNPKANQRETYRINADTNDLYIVRDEINWSNINLCTMTGEPIKIVNESGLLEYNIMTNKIYQSPINTNTEVIYQQPEWYQSPNTKRGSIASKLSNTEYPMGSWELVYPRVQSFRFASSKDGREYTPVRLQVIKDRSINTGQEVLDMNDNIVDQKICFINETPNGIELKLHNGETGSWEKI